MGVVVPPVLRINRYCCPPHGVPRPQITILAFYKEPFVVDISRKVVLKVVFERGGVCGDVSVACGARGRVELSERGAAARVALWLLWRQDVTVRGIYGRRIWDTWKLTTELLDGGMDVSPVISHRFNGMSATTSPFFWACTCCPRRDRCALSLPAPLPGLEDFNTGFDLMAAGTCGKVVFFPQAPRGKL